MDYSKKSNKIREIVRLQQILKKWKKLANAPKNTSSRTNINTSAGTTNSSSSSKSMKFLKRTLSFTDIVSNTGTSSNSNNDVVPKGFLAVCVGKELKRFIIPTDYLGHQAFGVLLQEAEDEFGFQQEGVLKIPCDVPVFEKILKAVEDKRSISDVFFLHDDFGFNQSAHDNDKMISCCSSPSHHPQLCR